MALVRVLSAGGPFTVSCIAAWDWSLSSCSGRSWHTFPFRCAAAIPSALWGTWHVTRRTVPFPHLTPFRSWVSVRPSRCRALH